MTNESDLQPGDVISVRFAGVLNHYGVVTYGGRIVSNSRAEGGVVSQSLAEFARGRPVEHHPRKSHEDGYRAHYHAHKRLGHDYSLTGSNCIDFVRTSRGETPTVSQYARATLMTLGDMFGSRRRY